jgi:hypothetical protein
MKFIKKDEYKNTVHEMRDVNGIVHKVVNDIIDDEDIYNNNKFVFDVIEDEKEEVIVEEKKDIIEDETLIEEVEKEIEVNEDFIEDVKDVIEKTVIDKVNECESIEEIHALAEENDVKLDKRKKNLDKLKEEFLQEYELN